MRPLTARCVPALAALLFAPLWPAAALDFTNPSYSSAVNDRFSGGFATNPVANTNINFVGAGFDWSGVGWSATDGTKGFGFISPQHYLVATHYGGSANIRIQQIDGTLATGAQRGLTNTGAGILLTTNLTPDLSLGTLQSPIADASLVARYAVLDLNASSTANSASAYTNQAVYLYGRGANGSSSPRIGLTTISNVVSSAANQYFTTPRTQVRLQEGDSGSPAFMVWTNVNGGTEITIVGNNAAIDATNNYLNFLGAFQVMNALNTTMTQDGFALRVAGNFASTWQGGSGGSAANQRQLARAGNWSGGSVPGDLYVRFQGDQTSFRDITVNSATSLRGLYFTSTGNQTNGFTFSGGSTLTIGRGGVVNYDSARQTFTANLTLGDHQYWDGGAGGITLSNLNSSGKLLEITGAGTNRITGNMSGSGGLAVSGGRLEVTASNSYTGATWVHGGRLVVDGRIDASSGVRVGAHGSLGGSGRVAAISGAGSVDPGNSPGILTAPSVDPAGGLDFNFEFTLLGSPVFGDAAASGNDLLRLTAATPFTAALASVNTVNIYMSFASLNPGDTFRGGFFADQISDFLASVSAAAFFYYLADQDGAVVYNDLAYRLFDDYEIEVGTVSEQAGFAGGTVTGGIVQFTVVPEPSTVGLLALAGLLLAAVAARRRAY